MFLWNFYQYCDGDLKKSLILSLFLFIEVLKFYMLKRINLEVVISLMY